MPMFHMEHCVFAAFLSDGTDYTNCGRPCDRHEVKFRDRVGSEHLIKADVGCRKLYSTPERNQALNMLKRYWRLVYGGSGSSF